MTTMAILNIALSVNITAPMLDITLEMESIRQVCLYAIAGMAAF